MQFAHTFILSSMENRWQGAQFGSFLFGHGKHYIVDPLERLSCMHDARGPCSKVAKGDGCWVSQLSL